MKELEWCAYACECVECAFCIVQGEKFSSRRHPHTCVVKRNPHQTFSLVPKLFDEPDHLLCSVGCVCVVVLTVCGRIKQIAHFT